VNPVLSAIKAKRREIYKLYVQEGSFPTCRKEEEEEEGGIT
jgi:hypothetical protein